MPHKASPRSLPLLPARLLRATLPRPAVEEIMADLATEFEERVHAAGRWRAKLWLWRQAIGSLPALVRGEVWRGMTGFESTANAMRPGGSPVESWINVVDGIAHEHLVRAGEQELVVR